MDADRSEKPPDARAVQERLVRALCASLSAELIETHISYVLLVGAEAYKIKKALDLGFLDFTTLDSRRHYCAEELRLNRRLAPQLYLDLVAVAGTAQAPAFAAADAAEAIEYAVHMRRFDQEALYDSLARRGQLGRQHIDALAAVLAEFHRLAAPAAAASPYGSAESIAAPMRQNFAQIRSLLPAQDDSAAVLDELDTWSGRKHAALAPLFAARCRQGRIRECHGDLHLGNVAWVDGAAVPFDGIEFNPSLRWIDVMSEIAFLMMDLQLRRSDGLAWRFLSAYLERSGDYGGLAVLDAYLVYRAMVRAKIAAICAAQAEAGTAQQAAAQADCREHLALAQRLTQPRQPLLLLMHGYAGSGKSALAQALVEAGGMLRLRSDVERKRLAGLAAEASSGSDLNAGLYGADMTRQTYAELARLARLVLTAGWPLAIDATHRCRWQRDLLRALAADCGVPCLIVACRADAEVLRHRVMRRAARGGDASEADLAVLEAQLADAGGTDAIAADEPALWVDTGGEEKGANVARVLREARRIASVPG